MRWGAILATLAGVLVSALSDAQTTSGPTDRELYAAFCSGVLSSSINTMKPNADSTPETLEMILDEGKNNGLAKKLSPNELLAWANSEKVQRDQAHDKVRVAVAKDEQQRRRFAAYLFATGVATDHKRPQALSGLLLAMKEGAAQPKQCETALFECATAYAAKTAEGYSKDSKFQPTADIQEELIECMTKNPSCSKIQKCNEPDDLPF